MSTPSLDDASAAEHYHRARLYNLAALAFDRPDDELSDALASGTFDEELLAAANGLDDGELADRAAAVVEASPDGPDAVDDLESTHAILFGLTEGGDVAPYEIAYAPGTLVTSTDTLADLSGFYGAFGLDVRPGNRERADHLCLQLEFCSHLAMQAAYLVMDGDREGVEVVTDGRASFLEDHLGRWLPRFRAAVEEATAERDAPGAEFYRSLASLTERLVAADADRLGVEPDVFDENPPEPLAGVVNDRAGDDFRCGTCGTNPSPRTDGPAEAGGPQFPIGDRDGPP